MLDSQTYNHTGAQALSRPLPVKESPKPPVSAARETQNRPEWSQNESALNWYKIETDDDGIKLTAVPNTYQVDVTSVQVHVDEVSAPKDLNLFGYRINLKDKIEMFQDNYVKNYALTKSHNLMVARFAEMKTAFYGYLLSTLGCASEDIRKLQKKAIENSTKQNKMLFEENEYNAELMAVVGGGGKKMLRAQQKVISEIRKQLIMQAKNLGMDDYYTQEKIIEIQVEQCQKILDKFMEEKNNLQYQLAISGEASGQDSGNPRL
ncbi:MAG: hypothetical protein WCT39_02065, partial [Candidatus Margulisiibacteriota bacterium]